MPLPRDINPYKVPAGAELDAAVHLFMTGTAPTLGCPTYSTDPKLAEKVAAKLKSEYGLTVEAGRTRIARKPYFARYDTDPSTSTEVIAETLPLAICRLALVRMTRDS